MMMALSRQKEPALLFLALACVSLFAWAVYAHWAEHAHSTPETARLCFFSPAMLFPWVPALCVLVFLWWKGRT
jgi:hypothetical protein